MGTVIAIVVVLVIVVAVVALLLNRRASAPSAPAASPPAAPKQRPPEKPMDGLESALAAATDRDGRPMSERIDAEAGHVDELRVPDDTGPLLRRALDHVAPSEATITDGEASEGASIERPDDADDADDERVG